MMQSYTEVWRLQRERITMHKISHEIHRSNAMEMKQTDLVLRDKRWLDLFPHHFIHGLALLLVALLPVAIAIILAQAKNSPDTTWAEFMSRLIEVVGAFDWSRMERPLLGGLMMIGFIAWQTAYMRWAQR